MEKKLRISLSNPIVRLPKEFLDSIKRSPYQKKVKIKLIYNSDMVLEDTLTIKILKEK